MDYSASTEVNTQTLERIRLDHRLKVGAGWFFWIAALTLVNTAMILINQHSVDFIIALGITQRIDAFFILLSSQMLVSNLCIIITTALCAGLFLFLGVRASQGQRWAFTLGMILYGLDSLFFIFQKDSIGLLFHVFVLLGLLGGLQALHEINSIPDAPSTLQTDTLPSVVH
jgi:hypothetical protein